MASWAQIRDLETGVYTREFFDEIIGRELEHAKRHGHVLSVLSILVVNWEETVAKAGAAEAAAALKTAAATIQANLRATDLLCRWGEDEFVVLLVAADLEACKQKIRLFGSLFRPWREGKGPLLMGVKIRVGASMLEDRLEFAGVLQAARQAARDRSGEQPAIIAPPAS
jgi:diguanylate cyclase (GGDEF)-like protein